MATLTIRQLDDRTHARLRGRAAEHGRSVEAEVRAILDAVVDVPVSSLEPADLGICVVTVEEIERGLQRLPRGKRRTGLEGRWRGLLATFSDSVATYDVPAAQHAARVLAAAQSAGRPMSLADAQIAGICLAGDHPLATRNVKDFARADSLDVINPWVSDR